MERPAWIQECHTPARPGHLAATWLRADYPIQPQCLQREVRGLHWNILGMVLNYKTQHTGKPPAPAIARLFGRPWVPGTGADPGVRTWLPGVATGL